MPRCATISERQIDKPIPMPSVLVVTKGINSFSCSACSIPEPLSLTCICSWFSSSIRLLSVMVLVGLSLMVKASVLLRIKLISTCSILMASTSSIGSASASAKLSVMLCFFKSLLHSNRHSLIKVLISVLVELVFWFWQKAFIR